MKKTEYELIDCGGSRKLEKFGQIILDRPAPHAIWKKNLSSEDWYKRNGIFFRNKDRASVWYSQDESLLDEWKIKIDGIEMILKPALNGQIGIFPEQLPNWQLLKKTVKNAKKDLKILNGFAYTGIANLFALYPDTEHKVEITHVDAAKSAITWAKNNAVNSGFGEKPIRWIVDDIVNFMEKEKKRENFYDIIILDPPAFGRTKDGKSWSFAKNFGHLLELTRDLLSDNPELVIISCHAPEINASKLAEMVLDLGLPEEGTVTSKELVLSYANGKLPAGTSVTWESIS